MAHPLAPAEPSLGGATADAEVFEPASSKRRGGSWWRWPLGLYTTPVALLLIWQVLSMAGLVDEQFMPSPVEVLQAGGDLHQSGELVPSLLISLQRAGIGLLIGLTVGITAGLVGGLARSGEYLFNGVFQIFNTIPLLALLPLMLVWFGIGETTKVLLIGFGAMVPMYLNLFAAVRGIDQRLVEMARTNRVSHWRMVRRVIAPGALPGFLVGLRFAAAYSVLGLVAAELINAEAGIGYLVNRAQMYMQIDQVFFGIVVYATLGLLADQAVRLLERRLLTWRPAYEAV